MVIDQIVVPTRLKNEIISLVHEHLLSGHLGVTKTSNLIRESFYWPNLKKDVKKFVNSCHTSQLTGKPNQVIPKAPLIKIPIVGEPFDEIVVDVVGPLPRSKKGNQFILTIIDWVTRYPEGIPL